VGFTVAHMGMFIAQAGFRELMDLLRHVAGRRWVKLKGVYRMSTAPGFADAATRHRTPVDNPQHLFRF
jgi:predicted TIM-barrel fold metal-dependent hydrolase